MKQLIYITFIALCISSCKPQDEITPNPHRMELDNNSKYYDQNYRVYTLDGCEYIVVGFGQAQWGSHKGNCKNPIHIQINK